MTWALGFAENVRSVDHAMRGSGLAVEETDTDFPAIQSSARVAMRSRPVSASSLYTLQLLANLL